jgi:hypothetical protein
LDLRNNRLGDVSSGKEGHLLSGGHDINLVGIIDLIGFQSLPLLKKDTTIPRPKFNRKL